ncbi:hypothetical protein BJY01DRAFT_106705 [Aspergillus pseudoustus]|uniref:C2H2-type domain-containing protein n=1 Tax=Aspergillus pseudoustus TaxID=1810923 RepID=A0ABR4IWK8_9EURO
MNYPYELLQSSSSLPPSSSSSSSSNDAVPQNVLAYPNILRSAPMFPFQSVDAGLGISYCEMGSIGDHMRHYQPSEHDSTDWLGQMMPTSLQFDCSLNTSHLSPATFYEPYSGSDASASPLSYCGPQPMSASPSRGPEFDYGTGTDMSNTHAYNFWPSTPRSEPDVQVKQEPDMEYRDEPYLGSAKMSVPIPPDAQSTPIAPPVAVERPGKMKIDTSKSAEARAGPDLAAKSSKIPPEIPSASGLTCTVCGAEFTRRSNCREHMKKHDPSGRKLYSCEDCGKSLGRKTDLKRHVDSVHRGIRRFGCDHCGYRFSRQDTLARHVADGCRRQARDKTTSRRRSSGNSSRTTR